LLGCRFAHGRVASIMDKIILTKSVDIYKGRKMIYFLFFYKSVDKYILDINIKTKIVEKVQKIKRH
jgi:hypothetical protein